jgi:hypothetical protein
VPHLRDRSVRSSTLEAVALLATLRADGCIVAAEGARLIVRGKYSDAQRTAIIARKGELLMILAAEGTASTNL